MKRVVTKQKMIDGVLVKMVNGKREITPPSNLSGEKLIEWKDRNAEALSKFQ